MMGIRENKVERYLDEKVRELDGETRAWKKSNRDGVPDQIVIIPFYPPWTMNTAIHFVEVKTTDGVLESCQEREQGRLRELDCVVTTVYGHSGVDSYIKDLISYEEIKREYR